MAGERLGQTKGARAGKRGTRTGARARVARLGRAAVHPATLTLFAGTSLGLLGVGLAQDVGFARPASPEGAQFVPTQVAQQEVEPNELDPAVAPKTEGLDLKEAPEVVPYPESMREDRMTAMYDRADRWKLWNLDKQVGYYAQRSTNATVRWVFDWAASLRTGAKILSQKDIVHGIPGDVSHHLGLWFQESAPTLEELEALTDEELEELSSDELAQKAHRLLTPAWGESVSAREQQARERQFFRLIEAHGGRPGQVHDILSRLPAQNRLATLWERRGDEVGVQLERDPALPWLYDGGTVVDKLSPEGKQKLRSFLEQRKATPGDWKAFDAYLDDVTQRVNRPGTSVEPIGDGSEAFSNGEKAFQQMYQAIDGAQSSVTLSVFGWFPDETGRDYALKLIEASRRGVDVKVIIDAVGCTADDDGVPIPPEFFQEMEDEGIEIVRYKQSTLLSSGTHNKSLVIDGTTGFIGGMNIAEMYMWGAYHDVHAKVTGPAVTDMQRVFIDQYEEQTGREMSETEKVKLMPQVPPVAGAGGGRVVAHDGKTDRAIDLAYLRAIDTAEEKIRIANPFVFDPDEIRHLVAAAERGVDVQVIVPHRNAWFQGVTAAMWEKAAKSGVQLLEYQGTKEGGGGHLHAKFAIFDGKQAILGSSNLNNRSLFNDDEANVVFDDPQGIRELEKIFFRDFKSNVQPYDVDWAEPEQKARAFIREPFL